MNVASMQQMDSWSPEQLHDWQRERARELIAHAAANSPFWRRRISGPDLEDVAPVTKPELMAAGADAFTGAIPEGTIALSTGGSSRVRGTFHYAPEEWPHVLAATERIFDMMAMPRTGQRLAMLVADTGDNMGARIGRTLASGNLPRPFDVSQPIEQLAAGVEAFAPDLVGGYSSTIALLADEQLAGRLRIAPRAVLYVSEPHTPDMTERVRAAWGVEPHDMYASTESGPTAADCEHHRGLHLMSANVVLEIPEDGRVLVTNLHNRLQPVIRYELQDRTRWVDGPCPCGRPHPMIAPVEGRIDDVLELGAAVHPAAFAPLAKLDGVRQFQIEQRGGDLLVRVVPTNGQDVEATVRATVEAVLARAGARAARIDVLQADALVRTAAGKVRLVRRVDC